MNKTSKFKGTRVAQLSAEYLEMVRATTHLKRKMASTATVGEKRSTSYQRSSKEAILSPMKVSQVTERGQALLNLKSNAINSDLEWLSSGAYPPKRSAWRC